MGKHDQRTQVIGVFRSGPCLWRVAIEPAGPVVGERRPLDQAGDLTHSPPRVETCSKSINPVFGS